jgi:hypothetical protein
MAAHAEHAAQALEIAHAEGLAMWQAIAGLQHLQDQARLTGVAQAQRIEKLITRIGQADRNYVVLACLFGVCALDASQQHAAALALVDDTLRTMAPEGPVAQCAGAAQGRNASLGPCLPHCQRGRRTGLDGPVAAGASGRLRVEWIACRLRWLSL